MTGRDRTGSRAERSAARRRRLGAASLVLAFALIAAACDGAPRVASDATTATTGATDTEPDGESRTLSVVDVGSGGRTAFTAPIGAAGFDFTPDGSMVTFTDSDESGNVQVFVMDADGSNQQQLTHGAGVELMYSPPQWSPDGSRIAYWALQAGGVELFVVRFSDGGSTRVTHEPKDVYEGGWASDRSFVFSISNPSSAYPLLARSIDLVTGETKTIARDVSTPEVSPDGTQIAFDSYFRPEGEAWLSVMNIDGTGRRKIQQVSYDGSYAKWSPDSTQIAYIDTTADGGNGAYVYDLTTDETRFLTTGTIESWIDNNHILVG